MTGSPTGTLSVAPALGTAEVTGGSGYYVGRAVRRRPGPSSVADAGVISASVPTYCDVSCVLDCD